MIRKIIKDVFQLKMDILGEINEHLPSAARERLEVVQKEIVTAVREAMSDFDDCHTAKNKVGTDKDKIKPVVIE